LSPAASLPYPRICVAAQFIQTRIPGKENGKGNTQNKKKKKKPPVWAASEFQDLQKKRKNFKTCKRKLPEGGREEAGEASDFTYCTQQHQVG
jgi:hypothetical protein